MRNAGAYLLSVVLIAGALSAVVSMATVQWLYPQRDADRTTVVPAVQGAPPAAADVAKPVAQPAPQPLPTARPAAKPAPASGPAQAASAEEKLALDFIRRAAAGDLQEAIALADGLTAEALREQVTRHAPAPQRVARLPGPPNAANLLVWSTTGTARSLYQVAVSGGKVRSLKGPMAPEGGYGPFPLALLDEQARPLDMTPYKGRALLLISPRAPEPGLSTLLTEFQATYGPQGIDVVLVMDIRSPDWVAAARAGGYQGPVWRVKARLEDVPLVAKGNLMGAYGVLVDREGVAVASLASLGPLHYNLPDETPSSIAPAVFRAYGLLP